MRAINRRIVAAHIVSSDGKVLFGRKRIGSGGVYPDSWHIPGGGVHEGETDKQALQREIAEETGIDITENARVSLIDDEGKGTAEKTLESGEKAVVNMQFNVYKVQLDCPASDVSLKDRGDLTDFRWFNVYELKNLDVTPPGKALFERLGTDWLKAI